MSNLFRAKRFSANLTVAGILCGVFVTGWCLTPQVRSQAPAASTPNAALAGLLGKLKAQQTLIAENQTKIEAQTAQLKEELQQAKIYSARSGAGRR